MSNIDFTGDVSASPSSICSICGDKLSRYNRIGYCFHHIPEQEGPGRGRTIPGRESPTSLFVGELIVLIQEWCEEAQRIETSEYLRNQKNGDESAITPDVVIGTVCKLYALDPRQMLEYGRGAQLVVPRQIIMYLLNKDLSLSSPEIGRILGRDHSTILYSVKKIEESIDIDPEFRQEIEYIRTKCGL